MSAIVTFIFLSFAVLAFEQLVAIHDSIDYIIDEKDRSLNE